MSIFFKDSIPRWYDDEQVYGYFVNSKNVAWSRLYNFVLDEIAVWDGECEGYFEEYIPRIEGSFEYFECDIEGEFLPGAGYIEGEFQLWNGSGYGNMANIAGDFQAFTADIEAFFAFNFVSGEFEDWSAKIYSGGNVEANSLPFTGSGAGTVGCTFGVDGSFEKWSMESFSGGFISGDQGKWTADILASVDHIDRIVGELKLFECDINGTVGRSCDIDSSFVKFSGVIFGSFTGKSSINGSVGQFSGSMSGIFTRPAMIDAKFMVWDSREENIVCSMPTGKITGNFLEVNGFLVSEGIVDDYILKYDRGKIR